MTSPSSPKPLPASEWQPIETAPKDGKRIIVYCPKLDGPKENIVSYQRNGTNFPWRADEGNLLQRDQPTHWMPLPEPPAGDESEMEGQGK